jgi:hypothetical protein
MLLTLFGLTSSILWSNNFLSKYDFGLDDLLESFVINFSQNLDFVHFDFIFLISMFFALFYVFHVILVARFRNILKKQLLARSFIQMPSFTLFIQVFIYACSSVWYFLSNYSYYYIAFFTISADFLSFYHKIQLFWRFEGGKFQPDSSN